MKKRVFLIYFLSLFFVSCFQENKTNVIQLNLGTTHYRELKLGIRISKNSTIIFPIPDYFNGIQKDNSWTFCYPDSIYDKSMSFTIQEITGIDTLSRYIGLKYIFNKDTLGMTNLSFANKDTTVINAIYLRTDTFPSSPETDINGHTIFKTHLIDYYLLTSCQDKELLSSLEITKNGFYWLDVDSSQYDTELGEYIDLSKKYPDSHFLIQFLNYNLQEFKSKNDVQKVFDCFAQDNRNSFYGKRINQYLTDNYFKNSILKTWDTGENAAIVIDSAKYNLILFSSTGCKPCIEEIPLLKKIYEDLSEKLEMTYVSIDNSKTVDEWRQLMKKENIPWRCVLAEEDVVNIIEKYYVWGVPYCLFIHPGGFMEQMEVRNTTELDYLYKIVQEEK